MKTTLNKIRQQSPCEPSWIRLLKSLNKTKADDQELSIKYILNALNLDDTFWCLRAVDGYDREKRLFVVWCAKQVKHLMIDERSLNALVVAEQFANGLVTDTAYAEAYAEAYAAYTDAEAYAEAYAAYTDAGACDAAYAAAAAAAYAAAAVRDVRDVRDAAAAYAACDAAVRDAAAAYAACNAAAVRDVLDAVRDVRDAVRDAQESEFIRMLDCIERNERYEIN